MVDSKNPFAFVLRKTRKCLDTAFYRSARSFPDIDDDMWLYLLDLVPSGRGTYGRRVRRMIKKLAPALRRYFLVRWFDGEWDSEGMEGICTSPDWLEVLPEIVAAFAELGAVQHAALIESLPPLVERKRHARTEAEQDALFLQFKRLDRKWKTLERTENLEAMIFESIKADSTPYLHKPGPLPTAGGNAD